jgi:hypothetical protein
MSKRLTFEYVKTFIEESKYMLLSDTYINSYEKLLIKCPENHIFEMTFGNFRSEYRCPFCAKHIKLTFKYVEEFIENSGYTLFSNNYINSHRKLLIKCPENHIFEMNFNNFQQGQRCPVCKHKQQGSKQEKELLKYVKSIYNGIVIPNDFNTIRNPETKKMLELDIYLPGINKAIEYNGTYWHKKDVVKNRDYIKKKQCKRNGVSLLIVTEDVWLYDNECCKNNINKFICNN